MDYQTKALSFGVVKLILIILVLSTSAKAAQLELDEENSTGSFSMFLFTYAGVDSDSYNYQDSGIFQVPPPVTIVSADSNCSASVAVIVSSGGYNAWDSDWGMGGCTFFYGTACRAQPYICEDTVIPAGFASSMNAEGNLIWEIIQNAEDEDSNVPVFVNIYPDLIFAGGGGTNANYETGIYDYTVEIESQSFSFPDNSFWTFAHFGDHVNFSYNTSITAATIDPTIDSSFSCDSASAIAPLIYVRSPDIVFIEKSQDALVKGACSDGETQLIVWFCAAPYDELDLSSIRLTVLSEDGKDNGHLIQEGEDNDGDDYDDTPQIIYNAIFTQTWCAPTMFDSVEGASNTSKSKEIPIQFELDIDKDGTYECVFVKNIELIRPPVVMVHGLWSDASAFSDLNAELYNNGFMYLYRPSYNNSASFATNDWVLPLLINNILTNLRTEGGYACTKVDIIAHSMGGLLAKRIEPSFAQKTVRKIITVGSPYQGSPLADLLINDILVNKPTLFGYLENFVFDKISHNEYSLSGGAVIDLRCNGGIHVEPEIPGVDCRGIVVGLRDGSFDFSVQGLSLGPYLTALRTIRHQDNEAIHNYLFGTDDSDWVVSASSQRGGASSLPPIGVMWHLTETKDADFKTLVIDLLNEPAQPSLSNEHLMAEQCIATDSQRQVSLTTENKYLENVITHRVAESIGTVEIIAPTEGQICTAGANVTVSVQGAGDTTQAAIFAFLGTYPWSDIVELPWEGEVNIPSDTVGSVGQIMVMGLDANMDMTAVDEVNVVLDTNVVLEYIFFGFGDKWTFDFKTFPQQSHKLQLYPMGRFSDGFEHPLSISGQTNYASSNETVVTVDTYGLMTVHSKGTSQITVTNSGLNTVIDIEVDTYYGDMNLDLKLDFLDFAIFANQWLLEKLSADIAPGGGDGTVNFVDYAVFADGWWGDINSLADFVSQWLKPSAYCADIAPAPSGDGIVDFLDLAAFADHWLEGTSP